MAHPHPAECAGSHQLPTSHAAPSSRLPSISRLILIIEGVWPLTPACLIAELGQIQQGLRRGNEAAVGQRDRIVVASWLSIVRK